MTRYRIQVFDAEKVGRRLLDCDVDDTSPVQALRTVLESPLYDRLDAAGLLISVGVRE